MGKNPISASLFPFLTFYRPPCLPTPPNWSFSFIPRQMASNSRYPSWEPHEVVLDTPGLPELQGGVCVCKTMDQIDLYITQIPALMHRVAQSKWNAARGGVLGERWGSEGQRVGEGKTGKKGEGQIPGEQISHRSCCICAIRKEITALDEGNCKGTRITLLYIVRGGSQKAQSERNERQPLQGCEETSRNVLRITCLRSVFV